MVNQQTFHLEQFLPVNSSAKLERLLSHHQHGYRKQLGCSTNILKLLEDVISDCEAGSDKNLSTFTYFLLVYSYLYIM